MWTSFLLASTLSRAERSLSVELALRCPLRLNPMLRVMWKLHRFILRVSGGRIGSRMGSMEVLLLETTGHKVASRGPSASPISRWTAGTS